MPKKVITGQFEGSRFSVENTWFSGAKLLYEGKVIATNNSIFALKKEVPFMAATIDIAGTERNIEVFAYAIFNVQLQIKVDGQMIAGENF
ncbi:MAG: hypothetical protein ACR2PX_28965 [Endozoicomonas sp.]|uniref:hypothetical protein n=1 Tax=Endozoicomonas sp. TaxID=1892382 RepID=UPI003D9B0F27